MLARSGNAAAFVLTSICVLLGACAERRPAAVSEDALVTITATDSGFVAPDTLRAGLNHFAFENRGSAIHECMFIRLSDGLTPAQYIAAVAAGTDFPEGALDCSGPGLTSPGERVEMWVPLEPGRYLLGCWFNSHITQIPPHIITVASGALPPADPPREDMTIRLIDFRFDVVGDLDPGIQVLKVETLGPSMHEMDMFRLDGGRTLEDLKTWYANRDAAPAPATAMCGVLDSHDLARVVWLRRNFTAGKYVLYCGMPMIQSGNEAEHGAAANATHAQAGMIQEIIVE
jgi:hypothetical protein